MVPTCLLMLHHLLYAVVFNYFFYRMFLHAINYFTNSKVTKWYIHLAYLWNTVDTQNNLHVIFFKKHYSRSGVGNQTNATFQRVSTMTAQQKPVQTHLNSAKQATPPQLTVRGSSTGSSVLIPVSSSSGPVQAPRTLNQVSPQPIIINKQVPIYLSLLSAAFSYG